MNTGQDLLTLSGHTAPVMSVAFSPDSKTLATGSEDKTAKLWDVATGKIDYAESTCRVRQFSCVLPDGNTLATNDGDYAVHLWHVSGRRNDSPQWTCRQC